MPARCAFARLLSLMLTQILFCVLRAASRFKDREGIINPIISPYIISLYFMMATLCTVGYGDIR